MWKVVDVNQEKQGAKYCSLGNTGEDGRDLRPGCIYDDELFSVSEKVINPGQDEWVEVKQRKFGHKAVVRNFIESLFKVKKYGVSLDVPVKICVQVMDEGSKLCFARQAFTKTMLGRVNEVVLFEVINDVGK